jgi:DNA topoisomerase IA
MSVEASVGHIRDLPQKAADIPAEYKKLAWAKEGVNIEEDFAPLYVINPDKKKKVSELKALMKDADELILATDEDREGEAIAWHFMEVLTPQDSRCAAWSSTRSPKMRSKQQPTTPAISITDSSMPKKHEEYSIAFTDTDSHQFSGRKSCRASPPAAFNQLQPD